MLTFTQLLKASADGLPLVKSDTYIKGATSNVGQVVMLKDNGNWKGCSVRFPGLDYDTWFSDEEKKDKRSHFMYELSFIPNSIHNFSKGMDIDGRTHEERWLDAPNESISSFKNPKD